LLATHTQLLAIFIASNKNEAVKHSEQKTFYTLTTQLLPLSFCSPLFSPLFQSFFQVHPPQSVQ